MMSDLNPTPAGSRRQHRPRTESGVWECIYRDFRASGMKMTEYWRTVFPDVWLRLKGSTDLPPLNSLIQRMWQWQRRSRNEGGGDAEHGGNFPFCSPVASDPRRTVTVVRLSELSPPGGKPPACRTGSPGRECAEIRPSPGLVRVETVAGGMRFSFVSPDPEQSVVRILQAMGGSGHAA